MKNSIKKLVLVIFSFLMIFTFSFSLLGNTVYARGGGSSHSSSHSSSFSSHRSSSTSKSTPKSGWKSSIFSKSSSSSSSSKGSSKSSSWSSSSSSHSSWIPPIVIFPHRTVYTNSLGTHYGYAAPSLLGIIIDIIIVGLIVYFVMWYIKRRRR